MIVTDISIRYDIDGPRTTAKLDGAFPDTDDEPMEIKARGTTVCSPKDEYDEEYGKKIAQARATQNFFEQVEQKILEQVNKKYQQKKARERVGSLLQLQGLKGKVAIRTEPLKVKVGGSSYHLASFYMEPVVIKEVMISSMSVIPLGDYGSFKDYEPIELGSKWIDGNWKEVEYIE